MNMPVPEEKALESRRDADRGNGPQGHTTMSLRATARPLAHGPTSYHGINRAEANTVTTTQAVKGL